MVRRVNVHQADPRRTDSLAPSPAGGKPRNSEVPANRHVCPLATEFARLPTSEGVEGRTQHTNQKRRRDAAEVLLGAGLRSPLGTVRGGTHGSAAERTAS